MRDYPPYLGIGGVIAFVLLFLIFLRVFGII